MLFGAENTGLLVHENCFISLTMYFETHIYLFIIIASSGSCGARTQDGAT